MIINEGDRQFFWAWFRSYAETFYSLPPEDRSNIALKEEHTSRVCENMAVIAENLSLGRSEALVAETVALFHDVGRFRQYADFRTFRDSISVNHGQLGAEVLRESGILSRLPEKVRDVILRSVTFHNAFSIPDVDDETTLYLKMIRDADKLDIWRVFIEYYESPDRGKASAAGLGLPDKPSYTPELLTCFQRRQIALLSQLKTLNDFKLLQLSWVYDLNFIASFRLLKERALVAKIIRHLPQTEAVLDAAALLQAFVEEKLHEGS